MLYLFELQSHNIWNTSCIYIPGVSEKEFVSNFIRSDVTSRDLLNYQKRALKEADVEALSLRDMLKAERALQNKPASEESRRR